MEKKQEKTKEKTIIIENQQIEEQQNKTVIQIK